MKNKKLSIVIPYYDETTKGIFPILSSIANQVGIDFNSIECILVRDGGGNTLPSDFLELFAKLDIRLIEAEENKGPGVARQIGLDNADGEYVMFCDADDVLHSVAVLGVFMQEIEQYHPDIITSQWLEEVHDPAIGGYVYIMHEDEFTWMHGKAFRRLFLQTKNIRFHDELRVHEDSYFLALASAATDNKRKLFATSYVWKYVPTSITRRNEALYTYESIPTFLRAVELSFRILEKSAPQEMQYKVVQLVMYNYFCLHQNHWLAPEREEYLRQAEATFKEVISPYMHHFEKAPIEFIITVYNQERAKNFNGGIEIETLDMWLQRVGVSPKAK